MEYPVVPEQSATLSQRAERILQRVAEVSGAVAALASALAAALRRLG